MTRDQILSRRDDVAIDGMTSDVGNRRGRLRPVVWSGVVSVLILSMLCLSRLLWHKGVGSLKLLQDVWVGAVLAQILALVAILVFARRSLSPLTCLSCLLPPLVVGAAVWLLIQGNFDATVFVLTEAALCLGFLVGWGSVPVGVLLLAWCIVTRKRSSPLLMSTLKVWLVVTVFLFTGETAARLFSRPRTVSVNPLSLPQQLPDSQPAQLNLAAIGGSTMLGFPYHPKVSLVQVAAQYVRGSESDIQVQVENLAEVGINFRMAAERLHQLQSRPDLLIVYTGHNEFFHDQPAAPPVIRPIRGWAEFAVGWSRSYQLVLSLLATEPQLLNGSAIDAPHVVNHALFTPAIVAQRVQKFEQDLRQLAEFAEAQSLPMLWFLPATNEGVFRPNRSVCERKLTTQETILLDESVHAARRLIERAQYESALARLQSLARQFPHVAEVEYWIGRCHLELGEFQAARDWFNRAADHDAYPANTITPYREAIRRVAHAFEIEVIDAAAVLREISPTGLLDRHVIHDNVHPTLRGFYELGRAAADSQTLRSLATERGVQLEPDPIPFDVMLQRLNFTSDDLATAYERTRHCLEELSRFRWLDRSRMSEAQVYGQWAAGLKSKSLQPGEQGTESFSATDAPGVRFPQTAE